MRFLRQSALALSRYGSLLRHTSTKLFFLGFGLVGLLLAVCIYDLYEILLLLGMPRFDWEADFPPVATPTTLTSDKFPRFQRNTFFYRCCCCCWCFFSSTRRETVFTSFRFFAFIDFFAAFQTHFTRDALFKFLDFFFRLLDILSKTNFPLPDHFLAAQFNCFLNHFFDIFFGIVFAAFWILRMTKWLKFQWPTMVFWIDREGINLVYVLIGSENVRGQYSTICWYLSGFAMIWNAWQSRDVSE